MAETRCGPRLGPFSMDTGLGRALAVMGLPSDHSTATANELPPRQADGRPSPLSD